MIRQPAVAGRFYPGGAESLRAFVERLYEGAPLEEKGNATLIMAPHAGYVYSGRMAAFALAKGRPARDVVLLGPNHTGRGRRLGLWDKGAWNTPACALEIAEVLAAKVLDACPEITPDRESHLLEHSLEVMIPLLCALDAATRIVPICVAEHDPERLERVGRCLGRVCAAWPDPVTLVVSSDMSHYVSQQDAKRLDGMALERATALDPTGLYEVVRSRGISMCGVLPMTLGLFAALEMGAQHAELVGYTTSGDVSGDFDQVVGYAGVVVR